MKTLAPILIAIFLTACASPGFDAGRSEAVLPLHKAWFDGRTVEYVTTDISDAGMARMLGVNYVPRLRDAIRGPGQGSLVERVSSPPRARRVVPIRIQTTARYGAWCWYVGCPAKRCAS
jgi:hypothetical protein